MLDSGTFSNSNAGKVLVDILNKSDDKIVGKKVGRVFNNYTKTLKELKKINTKIAIYLASMHYADVLKTIDLYPKDINTYLKNIVTTEYRKFLFEMDAHTPHKKRLNSR